MCCYDAIIIFNRCWFNAGSCYSSNQGDLSNLYPTMLYRNVDNDFFFQKYLPQFVEAIWQLLVSTEKLAKHDIVSVVAMK